LAYKGFDEKSKMKFCSKEENNAVDPVYSERVGAAKSVQ
jgi:hypothetical protein